jgi:hypothetical protein
MNRNWDIMRNAANGADPYGTTRRMDQNRMRDRERFTSRDRQEGFGGARWFDGVPDYGQSRYNAYRNDPNERQGYERQGYIPSYGDEGFGRPSQGWGAQGYGGEYQPRGTSRYGGYGYEHGESEALGGHYRGQHEQHERGLLGRLEEGIDRAFGNDWDRQERYRGMRDMRGEMRGEMRDDDHPSLWDRVKGAFTGGTYSGKGPKNWARSDERIREDVCECLTYHPNVDASEIDVTVKDGEVTLVGTVGDRMSKRLAEDIVEDVRGVKDVHNQLRVVRQNVQTQGMTGQSTQGTGTTTGQTGGMSTNQAWNQARR